MIVYNSAGYGFATADGDGWPSRIFIDIRKYNNESIQIFQKYSINNKLLKSMPVKIIFKCAKNGKKTDVIFAIFSISFSLLY